MGDAELMRRFQNDDHAAFEEIFDRYNQRILGFFIKYTRNKPESEDLCQDLFMKLVDKKHQFDVEKPFAPWVFRIASNMAKTNYTKIQRLEFQGHEINQDHASNNDSLAERIELKNEIRLLVEQLTEPHKTTFILRHYTSLSIKEVATVMNCSEGTIKSRLFTTHKRLKSDLKTTQNATNF